MDERCNNDGQKLLSEVGETCNALEFGNVSQIGNVSQKICMELVKSWAKSVTHAMRLSPWNVS
jgi:hypothetical protein